MSKDEVKTNSRMGESSDRGEAKRASLDYSVPDPVPRDARSHAHMETSDAPLRALSDVWPEDKDVPHMRVLPPVQSGVSRAGMSRRVDRRPFRQVGQVNQN
jgi:hypothetical protein